MSLPYCLHPRLTKTVVTISEKHCTTHILQAGCFCMYQPLGRHLPPQVFSSAIAVESECQPATVPHLIILVQLIGNIILNFPGETKTVCYGWACMGSAKNGWRTPQDCKFYIWWYTQTHFTREKERECSVAIYWSLLLDTKYQDGAIYFPPASLHTCSYIQRWNCYFRATLRLPTLPPTNS